MGLADRVPNRLHIKGLEADQVDQFNIDTFLGQLLHRLEAMMTHSRIGQNRDITALAHDLSAVKGANVIAFRDVLTEVVEEDMLKEENWIVVANRCLHQSLGIRWCADSNDLDTRNGMKIGLKPLAVLGTELTTHSTRTAHNGRNREIAAAGVTQHPHIVGDLIEGQ